MNVDLNDLRRRIVAGEEVSREELKQALLQQFPKREEAFQPTKAKAKSKKKTKATEAASNEAQPEAADDEAKSGDPDTT